MHIIQNTMQQFKKEGGRITQVWMDLHLLSGLLIEKNKIK